MSNKTEYATIHIPKPKCYLSWENNEGQGMTFEIFRDFNWFQQKMLKFCFGLEYTKYKD